jgi:tetratricopeptide (TPR) repeat protein
VGDSRSVETAWKRILEISPDNPKLRVTFANLLLEMHLPGEAAREWTTIADLYRARGDEKGMQAAETRVREILAAAPHATMPSPQAPSGAAAPSAESARSASAPATVESQSEYLSIEWNAEEVPTSPGGPSEPEALQFTDLFGTSEAAGMEAAGAAEEEAEGIRGDSAATDEIAIDLSADFAAPGAPAEGLAGPDSKKPPGNVSVRERAEQEDDLIDLDEVLDEFRSGVSQVIGGEDSQSQYDLGMSYKEMELYDDAINAFRAAMSADDLRLPAIEMIGECLLAKGDAAAAITELSAVIDSAGEDPRAIGLRYTLGNAYLRQNDRQHASECYEAIVAVDPTFRDVAARIEHLRERAS